VVGSTSDWNFVLGISGFFPFEWVSVLEFKTYQRSNCAVSPVQTLKLIPLPILPCAQLLPQSGSDFQLLKQTSFVLKNK
jgi:hypothetical protein